MEDTIDRIFSNLTHKANSEVIEYTICSRLKHPGLYIGIHTSHVRGKAQELESKDTIPHFWLGNPSPASSQVLYKTVVHNGETVQCSQLQVHPQLSPTDPPRNPWIRFSACG